MGEQGAPPLTYEHAVAQAMLKMQADTVSLLGDVRLHLQNIEHELRKPRHVEAIKVAGKKPR